MAGRAGRRGKDDKGIVIYLPDHDPVEPSEIKAMMKGSRPPILSRMDFHYDFILKTIQSSEPGVPLKWLYIMEQSYWFQLRQKRVKQIKEELDSCQRKIADIKMEEMYYTECDKRWDLEQKIKQTVNAARKEVQKQLDSLKNKQFGPKWNAAWTAYNTLRLLKREEDELQKDLESLESHQESITPSVEFLYDIGYIKNKDSLALKNEDLTLKGILATEINEGHQILMTELYTQELLHNLSGDDLTTVLACFLEHNDKDNYPTIWELEVTDEVKKVLIKLNDIVKDFRDLEDKIGYPIQDYWKISLQMIEPIQQWITGMDLSFICRTYGLFEGNFIRSIMKLANIIDEWLAMATYCQHIEQIIKMQEVRQRIIRDIVISDSLYLHL